ncbi:hypothetical protein MHYP_G00182520 [Metynnis hypsauchen]
MSTGTLRMVPAKIRAVLEWPCPTSLRLVQHCLWFANFFWHFLRNFSSVVAPLTVLTQKTPGPFCWTIEAQKAFEEIKAQLTSSLVLQLPDPEEPQWAPLGPDPSLEPINPTSWILAPLSWELETGIRPTPSKGNTVILVLVDHFSKACKFVALPKLPSAKETAEVLLQHVVRVHGMPSDLVSDQGSLAAFGRPSARQSLD